MRKARTVISSDYTKLGRRTGPKAKELAEQLRKIWAEQKGICPLSGRKLSRKTAELDHIKPRSKGGKSKPVNLRFLHKDVNQAMRALTDKSFIELCKEVAKRAGAG
jgi:5-methylcytosine-specific restriction endonuclease McrA